MKRTKPWELSDEVWERVRPLIPERPAHPKGDRPARSDRQMLSAVRYLLRAAHWYPMECFATGVGSQHNGV